MIFIFRWILFSDYISGPLFVQAFFLPGHRLTADFHGKCAGKTPFFSYFSAGQEISLKIS